MLNTGHRAITLGASI